MLRILFIIVFLIQALCAVELPDGVEDAAEASSRSGSFSTSSSEVSILCYHDFSDILEPTEMRIQTEVFERQMETLKSLNLNVISLKEFILWKKGQLALPDSNILITIDDGWSTVGSMAFPILKKYKFPFALGLYKEFIGTGALSLEVERIQTMLNNGMAISSHSVSHPLPSAVRSMREQGEKPYTEFLRKEFGESKTYLEQVFLESVTTYTYPGGYYSPEMFPLLRTLGYEYAFTVKPGKVTIKSPDYELPRYVVLGTTHHVFDKALEFSTKKDKKQTLKQTLAYPVKPLPNEEITQRLPWIGVDLENAQNVDSKSIKMYVSGFGAVSGAFIPETKRFEWQASRPLRSPSYQVLVKWKKKGGRKYQQALKWQFSIDHKGAYIESGGGK